MNYPKKSNQLLKSEKAEENNLSTSKQECKKRKILDPDNKNLLRSHLIDSPTISTPNDNHDDHTKLGLAVSKGTIGPQKRVFTPLPMIEGAILQLNPLHIKISSEVICRAGGRDIESDNDLMRSIKAAGTNTEPVLVRAIFAGQNDLVFYELISGQRRLQTCRELGLPIKAHMTALQHIDALRYVASDGVGSLKHTLIDRGRWAKSQIDAGHFKTAAELCEAVGWDEGTVSRAMTLLELPEVVTDLFVRSKGIQHRHISPLNRLHKTNPQELVAGAKHVARINEEAQFRLTAKDLFNALLLSQESKPKIQKISPAKAGVDCVLFSPVSAPSLKSTDWRSVSSSCKPVVDDDGLDLANVFRDENGFVSTRYCFENLKDADLDWLASNLLGLIIRAPFYQTWKENISPGEKG